MEICLQIFLLLVFLFVLDQLLLTNKTNEKTRLTSFSPFASRLSHTELETVNQD